MLGDESENRFHMECMRRLVFTGGRVGHFIILPVVVHPSTKLSSLFVLRCVWEGVKCG